MRGPYETSAEKFSDCACHILNLGENYTIYESVKKCDVSYTTIKNYLTINLHDIQQLTAKKCKRRIEPEKILRYYPGFRVAATVGSPEVAKQDLCKTELAKDEEDEKFKQFRRSRWYTQRMIPDAV